MKVALIGVGRWGQILLKELKLQAEVKYECDSKTDLDQVFNDAEVKAVFIATPTGTHFEIAKKALEASKHVFLEKPGASTSAELEVLAALAASKGLKLAIGYEFVHQPAIQKLKELMAGEKSEFVRIEWRKWGSFKDEIERNLLCHHVSVLKYLGIDLAAPFVNRAAFTTEADILETRFGQTVVSIINRVSPSKSHTMHIKLPHSAYLWCDSELFKVVGDKLEKIEVADAAPVGAEIEDFLNSAKPLCDGNFALEVYKIIESVQA